MYLTLNNFFWEMFNVSLTFQKIYDILYLQNKRKELIEMKHYLFEDLETGEEFIVGADCVTDASITASEYFEEPHFICQLTEFEAEASGLDEY